MPRETFKANKSEDQNHDEDYISDDDADMKFKPKQSVSKHVMNESYQESDSDGSDFDAKDQIDSNDCCLKGGGMFFLPAPHWIG